MPTNFNSFARFDIRAYGGMEAVQLVVAQSVEISRIFAAHLNSRDPDVLNSFYSEISCRAE